MRKAKISGAIAWYLECPACEGAVVRGDGSYMHGNHDHPNVLWCEDCGLELAPPKLPKKIPVH